MRTFLSGFNLLDAQIPDGIPYPSSTIITGPAGSGKPLLGSILAAAWLKHGGTLVHLLLNLERQYADKLLEKYLGNVHIYRDRVAYIEFDPLIKGVEKTAENNYKANLLIPENLNSAIQKANELLKASKRETMIYGSALNMLLFSRTYGRVIHKKILALLKGNNHTVFTISNNIFEKQAAEWESAVDNLILSYGTGIMHIACKIKKMKKVTFAADAFEMPVSEDELFNIRRETEKARKNLIPLIRKI